MYIIIIIVIISANATVLRSHEFFRQLSAFSLCSSGLVLPYWSFEL